MCNSSVFEHSSESVVLGSWQNKIMSNSHEHILKTFNISYFPEPKRGVAAARTDCGQLLWPASPLAPPSSLTVRPRVSMWQQALGCMGCLHFTFITEPSALATVCGRGTSPHPTLPTATCQPLYGKQQDHTRYNMWYPASAIPPASDLALSERPQCP